MAKHQAHLLNGWITAAPTGSLQQAVRAAGLCALGALHPHTTSPHMEEGSSKNGTRRRNLLARSRFPLPGRIAASCDSADK
jgi:hypothetical protein